MSKVLVLASYCGAEDENGCTDTNPCQGCLDMCNVFDVPSALILEHHFVAQFDNFKRGEGRRSPQESTDAS